VLTLGYYSVRARAKSVCQTKSCMTLPYTALQIRSQREKMAELQSQHEAQVKAVLEKYSVLRKVVTQYNQRISQAISTGVGGSSGVGLPQGCAPMICT